MKRDDVISILLNASSVCGTVWNREGRGVDCNDRTLRFFGLASKQAWLDCHINMSVQCLQGGATSGEQLMAHLSDAFRDGRAEFSWPLRRADGRIIPTQITFTRVGKGERALVVALAVEQHDSHITEASDLDSNVRAHLMLDNSPFACTFWNVRGELIDCNFEALKRYNVSSKEELIACYAEFLPEYQPDGGRSDLLIVQNINKALQTGRVTTLWMHSSAAGEPMPCEVTLVRVFYNGEPMIVAFIRDLREETRLAAEKHEGDERMQIMLDSNPLGCSFWDETFQIVDCNAEVVRLFGLSSKQEVLERFSELSPEYQSNGERSADLIPRYLQQANRDGYLRLEWMHQKLDGDPLPVEVTLVRVQRSQGNVIAIYIRDLREEQKLQIEKNEAHEYSQLMLDAMPLCCNMWDEAHNHIACNLEAIKLFELGSRQEYLNRFFELSPEYQPCGRLSRELAHEQIDTAFRDGYARFEWMHQKLSGEPVPAEITLVRIQHGKKCIVACYARDLRELRNSVDSLKRLETLAYTDKLTAISNRHHFLELATDTLDNVSIGGSACLLLLDIDHFKRINDTYGHGGGDAILQGFAMRIKEILRPYDLFARYGGEEFVILLGSAHLDAAITFAERMRETIEGTLFTYQGYAISVTTSIGIAVCSYPAPTLQDMVNLADAALYQAKHKGRNRVEFRLFDK